MDWRDSEILKRSTNRRGILFIILQTLSKTGGDEIFRTHGRAANTWRIQKKRNENPSVITDPSSGLTRPRVMQWSRGNKSVKRRRRQLFTQHTVQCGDNVCIGHEKACSNGTCWCYHTKTPVLPNGSCERKLALGTPAAGGIPILFNTNQTTTPPIVPLSIARSTWLTWEVGVAFLFFLLSLSLGIACCIKRKSVKRLLQKPPPSGEIVGGVNLRLLPERFIPNPTYDSMNLELSIRVFSQDEVTIVAQIGMGCFGKVFKAELNGKHVAVKVVQNDHGGEAMKEIETMAAFSHPNILHMVGVAKNEGQDAPWLVFEFMEHGDLASVLRKKGDEIPFPIQKEMFTQFACQISEGMRYLSSQHFVHRDLAARNCLLGANGIVKISDFGLSRDVYTCDYYKIGGSRMLPVRWMSPESVLYGRFTLESDVWAYGVLLWEIYSWGKQPYYGHSNEEVVQLILDGVLLAPPPDTPGLILELMAGSWKTDPKDRITFSLISDTFKNASKKVRKESEYEVPKEKPKADYMLVL